MKARGYQRPVDGFNPIVMPNNTASGIVLAGLSFVFGFAMVWYIWWLAGLSLLALIAVTIRHTFTYRITHLIPAEAVARCEGERTLTLKGA